MPTSTYEADRAHMRHAVARRSLIAGAPMLPLGSALAQEPLTRRGTPQLTSGPFYPLARPPEEYPSLGAAAIKERATAARTERPREEGALAYRWDVILSGETAAKA